MARSIQSPGVEIREKDLSLSPVIPAGTNIFMAGFAAKGPTDEVLQITSVEELEQVYGTPTNSAERYFYHSARQILNVPAGTLFTTRLPYGQGSGEGYGSKYGALVYPVVVAEKKSYKTYRLYDVDKSVFTIPTDLSSLLANDTIVTTTKKIIVDFYTDLQAITQGDLNDAASLIANGIVGAQRKISVADGDKLRDAVQNLRDAVKDSTYYDGGTLPTSGTAFDAMNAWHDNLDSLYTRIKDYWFSDDVDVHTNLDISESNTTSTYVLGAPKFFELSIDEYNGVIERSAFTSTGGDWSLSAKGINEINGPEDFGHAGLIVLNKIQSTINGKWEGHYLSLIDNTNLQPSTDSDSLTGIYTNIKELTLPGGEKASQMTPVVDAKLAFKITDSANRGGTKSLAETIENLAFEFSDMVNSSFDDILGVSLIKLRTSPYAPTSIQLDYMIEENFVGSLDFHRQINSKTGGLPTSFFADNLASTSNNMVVMTNSYISGKNRGSWQDAQGVPRTKVRLMGGNAIKVLKQTLNASQAKYGFTSHEVETIQTKLIDSSGASVASSELKYANSDNVYPIGVFSSSNNSKKLIGEVGTKLDRVLRKIENDELFDVSLLIEAGLGTIYTASQLNAHNGTSVDQTKTYFDDEQLSTKFKQELAVLKTSMSNLITDNYRTVFDKFDQFCSSLRKDCMFIADPLRHILITGADSKTLSDRSKTFSSDVYEPLKNLFAVANSSYTCTYANWVKINDGFSSTKVWIPFSAWAAADMAAMDANFQPWYAPAGFTRGKVTGVLDVALTPKQKERDSLYKISVNPVAYFPGDGFNIFGQKTMLRQPSAFDRINVRRLFIFLQKATKKTTRYFVFEPNTAFTRSRLVNTLRPIFNIARNDSGIKEYEIVCDDRNNPAAVVDQNELVVDIYVKPIRTAEFILVNFYATSTSTSFSELIAG